MNRYLIILLIALVGSLYAHPGIGLVKDSKGNLFYTDLSKILKVSTDGKQTVVVPNVHSHEIFMDKDDNLYGVHLWYTGEASNKWMFYYWTRRKDGTIVKLQNDTEGFEQSFSFVRDALGNHYLNRKWKDGYEFYRIKPDSTIEILGQGKFDDIRWMFCTEGGTLYFIDLDKIYQLKNGQFRLIALNLIDKTVPFSWMDKRHSLYGLWADDAENIYVCVYSGQKIKKIAQDGIVSTIYQSKLNWSPTNGLFDKQGNLWVMETSLTNNVRLQKVEKSKIRKSEMPLIHIVFYLVVSILVLGFFIVRVRFKQSKHM